MADEDYNMIVDSDEEDNAGLRCRTIEFRLGDKGRLTTKHSNPRAVKDADGLSTLSVKIGGKEALKRLIDDYEALNKKGKFHGV
jgi:hypothetical protein